MAERVVGMSHDGDGVGRGVDRDSWFNEIDLDPDGAWLRMGTRSLGDRPWLIVDDRRGHELALKHRLLVERRGEVFAAAPDAGQASVEVHGLVLEALERVGVLLLPDSDGVPRHPLDRSGRLVQEDLCLLRPIDGRWVLAAASLCFPSRWRLADKLERPLLAVHGPVAGYGQNLGDRVDSLLTRLGERIVWRRNWFVHPDGALFQPRRPPQGDPVVIGDRWRDELFVRSERQTLRRLQHSGWVLFTIRIQHCPLGRFLADGECRSRFDRYLTEAAPDLLAHRGMAPAQVDSLRVALGL